MRAICKDNEFPDEAVVRGWVIDDREGFASQYTRARDIGLDAMADQLLLIANTPQEGVTTTDQEWGTSEKRGDMIEHRRLQVDAHKWYLSKMAPKRYGDRIDVAVTGDVSFGARLADARKKLPDHSDGDNSDGE